MCRTLVWHPAGASQFEGSHCFQLPRVELLIELHALESRIKSIKIQPAHQDIHTTTDLEDRQVSPPLNCTLAFNLADGIY